MTVCLQNTEQIEEVSISLIQSINLVLNLHNKNNIQF